MKSPPPFSRLPFFAKQKKKNVCEGGREGGGKGGKEEKKEVSPEEG